DSYSKFPTIRQEGFEPRPASPLRPRRHHISATGERNAVTPAKGRTRDVPNRL
ncbi:hypothetical protein E4U36_000331, partial [Claviceps purpurea]